MGSKKSADQWGPDVGKEFFQMRHTNPKMEAIFGGIDEKVFRWTQLVLMSVRIF